jgi:hypothetical protein
MTNLSRPCTVFYSWQAQLPARVNRSFIESALEQAAKTLRADATVEALPEVDQGAANVPGAPNIADTILAKIDAADAVVFDVTLVPAGDPSARTDGIDLRSAPNANVLIELGYALSVAGRERIVLVMNTAYGKPEMLPFDLRQRHVVTYHLPVGSDGKAEVRKALVAQLERKLRDVLGTAKQGALQGAPTEERPELSLQFETKKMDRDNAGTVVVHHYELVARLANTTKKRLNDWYIEVELPTPLLEPHTTYATLVRERSTPERSVFRTSTKLPPLPSGDPYEWRLPYRVDDKLFWNQRPVVEQASAVARVFVDGALVAEKTLSEIQNF